MTCPGTYPTVLNGQIYSNSSTSAEYECLTGFQMTGNKVITCSGGTWGTAPTCTAIRQYDEIDVFPEWWHYVAAAVACLLVLCCLLCIICYFCCGRGDNSVYPYRRHNNGCCGSENGCYGGSTGCCSGGCGCCAASAGCCLLCGSGSCCARCCRDSNSKGKGKRVNKGYSGDDSNRYHTVGNASSPNGQNGVYFVPNSVPPQGGYFVYHRPPADMRNKGTNTDRTSSSNNTSNSSGYGNSNGTLKTSSNYIWAEKTPRESNKAWTDSAYFETTSDGDVTDKSGKSQKRAKEIRAWLPHSNPVRPTHNTSTK